MVLPLPLQAGQACCTEKMPCCIRTRPWPRQVEQVSTLPSSDPEPLQGLQATSVGTSICFSTPKTASSRSSSIT
jgi:hypothetical protein